MLPKPNFSLSGRIAVVTGASRGIGKALALGLASAGATVVVTARSAHALADVVTEIANEGGRAFAIPMDVSSLESINSAFNLIADSIGTPSILVNNAGVEELRSSLSVDEAVWDRIIGTNLKGAFFCAQRFAKCGEMHIGMARSIINLCSLTSEVGVPGAVPYGASKSGLVGVTRALATEWASMDVRVNGIGPGYFRTDLTDVFYRDETWSASMLEKIPMKRFGLLEDLVGAAVFLASDASRYVTGQVIYVDGGYLASI